MINFYIIFHFYQTQLIPLLHTKNTLHWSTLYIKYFLLSILTINIEDINIWYYGLIYKIIIDK